ncbi:MAG: ATP-binding cassette domain-containing protein [Meiothermus sp.]|uniref:ATP-binding cassette domain-containing protein n=1 Tax=Meiothermus sp. TaxID=1955249 RepID=UPI0025CD5410|nr:ATP-binding cassette domain-containing protein [Meiothermus sp.]MCS7193557.1 ATP-binding cassette domain-containing protein [Meiothermus sp.]MDW8090570.1 ATP-binding cassette domain-containing protein [Meiothermus sp.]
MTPLVEMRNICLRFGGNQALDNVSVNLYPGEVVGLLGHNGAGKSTLIKVLSGAYQADSGQIRVDGREVQIRSPQDAQALGIETIYQNLALADNLDAVANVFLGREKVRGIRLDEDFMELEARKTLDRLRVKIPSLRVPVAQMSGGQRQTVAIGRALYFKARCLIMDEPTAALGPEETAKVGELIKALKAEGVGIFLISHDLHDVFDLADRITVMKNGRVVGTVYTQDVSHDDVLGMIIGGVMPKNARPAQTPLPTG